MTLSDLASLAGVVSGLAVLVSLIFLYFQMRQLGEQLVQTQKNQRTMINESFAARIVDLLRWISEPTMASLMVRVRQGEQSFSVEELLCLSNAFRAAVLTAQATSQHYEAGLIDQISYDTNMLSFRGWLIQPVFRAMWRSQLPITAPPFRARVEAMLRDTPLAAPADLAAEFRRELAKVLAPVPQAGAAD